jgi:hypothetical protein
MRQILGELTSVEVRLKVSCKKSLLFELFNLLFDLKSFYESFDQKLTFRIRALKLNAAGSGELSIPLSVNMNVTSKTRVAMIAQKQ